MAKSQSLAAQSGALTKELQLPAVFSAPQTIKARSLSPYIAFAHPKRADEWAKAAAKYGQPEEGDIVFVYEGDVFKVDALKLGWLAHKQYWAQTNAAGTELIAASLEEQPHPWKEHIEAAVLVYWEEKVVAANVCFRTTKCGAAQTMAQALADAAGNHKPGNAAWADRSPAHKETLVANAPWMRFFGLVSLGDRRTGKGSGLPYRPTKCEIQPTGVAEWRAIDAWSKDPEAQKEVNAVAARFEQRFKEVTAKIK